MAKLLTKKEILALRFREALNTNLNIYGIPDFIITDIINCLMTEISIYTNIKKDE